MAPTESVLQPKAVGTKCPSHLGAARLVFAAPVPVYAGGMHARSPRGATVVDLAGQLAPTVMAWGFSIPGFTSRYVRVHWADHSTPDLTVNDWQTLTAALRDINAPIMVGCMGGHGRTGTTLAILGHFLRAYPDATTDPIAHVRAFYCPEAVETNGQVEYIKAMTGRATECKGSIGTVSGGSGSALCPVKIKDEWCNLDSGHNGAHDTRKRPVLIALGLAGSKGSKGKNKDKATDTAYQAAQAFLDAQPYNVKAKAQLSAALAPATFCRKTVECLARAGHAGPCVNVVGDAITGTEGK